jgi:hypothetical protein
LKNTKEEKEGESEKHGDTGCARQFTPTGRKKD